MAGLGIDVDGHVVSPGERCPDLLHRRRHVVPGRGQIRQQTAQAETHRADLALARGQVLEGLDGRPEVGSSLIDVEPLVVVEGLLHTLRIVIQLNPRLHTPEQVRRQDDVALGGERVG
jgi:hypothetical protein